MHKTQERDLSSAIYMGLGMLAMLMLATAVMVGSAIGARMEIRRYMETGRQRPVMFMAAPACNERAEACQ